MVLLLHELPETGGGGRHYDWMLERPGGGGGLLSFRVMERMEGARAFEAERVADHRKEYLDYEGEVSGGRGRVRRVAEGIVDRLEETDHRIEIRGVLGGIGLHVVGQLMESGLWHFESRGPLP